MNHKITQTSFFKYEPFEVVIKFSIISTWDHQTTFHYFNLLNNSTNQAFNNEVHSPPYKFSSRKPL